MHLLLRSLALLPLLAQAPERLHLVVLHTNDVHGQVQTRKATWIDKQNPPQVGGLPRLAAYVHRAREESAKRGDGLLVVDSGDWYQGTPEGLVDGGVGFVGALAQVGYDACAIGNHEFDRGLENLKLLLRDSGIPSVCANLTERSSGKPVEWTRPWRIANVHGHDAAGDWTLAVGLVGLLTTTTPVITHPDAGTLVFGDPSAALSSAQKELAGKAEWILPLSHLGLETDRGLARAHPELQLIVGGHSHTYLAEGVREGPTCIVQTGSKASSIGRVDVWFERATKKCVEVRASVVDLREEPAEADRNAEVERRCAALVQRSDEPMREVIGELAAPLVRTKDALKSSSAGNFLADIVREHTGADIGLMNRGGIRCDVEAGPFTRRQIFELSPFDNRISVLELPGADLTEMLRRSVEDMAHSGLEVSGLTVEAGMGADGKRRFGGIRIGGKPVEAAAKYKVAMNSFLADGGDVYLDKQKDYARKDEALFVRELVELWVAEHKRVTPASDERYVTRP